jgi:hypothetical protein
MEGLKEEINDTGKNTCRTVKERKMRKITGRQKTCWR